MFVVISDFILVVSLFRRCKKRKTIRATMDGFVGGVALIRFPGGFGLLEIVPLGQIFWRFF